MSSDEMPLSKEKGDESEPGLKKDDEAETERPVKDTSKSFGPLREVCAFLALLIVALTCLYVVFMMHSFEAAITGRNHEAGHDKKEPGHLTFVSWHIQAFPKFLPNATLDGASKTAGNLSGVTEESNSVKSDAASEEQGGDPIQEAMKRYSSQEKLVMKREVGCEPPKSEIPALPPAPPPQPIQPFAPMTIPRGPEGEPPFLRNTSTTQGTGGTRRESQIEIVPRQPSEISKVVIYAQTTGPGPSKMIRIPFPTKDESNTSISFRTKRDVSRTFLSDGIDANGLVNREVRHISLSVKGADDEESDADNVQHKVKREALMEEADEEAQEDAADSTGGLSRYKKDLSMNEEDDTDNTYEENPFEFVGQGWTRRKKDFHEDKKEDVRNTKEGGAAVSDSTGRVRRKRDTSSMEKVYEGGSESAEQGVVDSSADSGDQMKPKRGTSNMNEGETVHEDASESEHDSAADTPDSIDWIRMKRDSPSIEKTDEGASEIEQSAVVPDDQVKLKRNMPVNEKAEEADLEKEEGESAASDRDDQFKLKRDMPGKQKTDESDSENDLGEEPFSDLDDMKRKRDVPNKEKTAEGASESERVDDSSDSDQVLLKRQALNSETPEEEHAFTHFGHEEDDEVNADFGDAEHIRDKKAIVPRGVNEGFKESDGVEGSDTGRTNELFALVPAEETDQKLVGSDSENEVPKIKKDVDVGHDADTGTGPENTGTVIKRRKARKPETSEDSINDNEIQSLEKKINASAFSSVRGGSSPLVYVYCKGNGNGGPWSTRMRVAKQEKKCDEDEKNGEHFSPETEHLLHSILGKLARYTDKLKKKQAAHLRQSVKAGAPIQPTETGETVGTIAAKDFEKLLHSILQFAEKVVKRDRSKDHGVRSLHLIVTRGKSGYQNTGSKKGCNSIINTQDNAKLKIQHDAASSNYLAAKKSYHYKHQYQGEEKEKMQVSSLKVSNPKSASCKNSTDSYLEKKNERHDFLKTTGNEKIKLKQESLRFMKSKGNDKIKLKQEHHDFEKSKGKKRMKLHSTSINVASKGEASCDKNKKGGEKPAMFYGSHERHELENSDGKNKLKVRVSSVKVSARASGNEGTETNKTLLDSKEIQYRYGTTTCKPETKT